jgi:hypothetical protein
MRILLLLPALLLIVWGLPAQAADREKFAPVPEPPAPVEDYRRPAAAANTPAADTDEAIPEPEVVITTKGEDRHEEYRIGGRLYMIKVIPKRGAPYYLIDREGQGEFVKSDLLPSINPPMWVIKRF